MPALTIGFGLLLMVISIGTYAIDSEGQDAGAFAPAVLGLLIMGCGIASIIKSEYKMHLMHGAVLLASIGVLYPLVRLIQFMFPLDGDSLTVTRNLLVPLACGVFLYLAIQSFITARKTRTTSEPVNKEEDRAEPNDVA